MISELELRRYAPSTIKSYIGGVSLLARDYGRCPSRLSDAEVLRWLEQRLRSGKATSTVHQGLMAVRFLWREVLNHPSEGLRLPKLRRTQRLPEVLSHDEVAALLCAHPKPCYRAALHLLYGCGLRVSEVARLETGHIERAAMRVRVEQAKGNKDRCTILPRRALGELEAYWSAERCDPPLTWEPMPLRPWLFLGRQGEHLGADAIARAYHEAKARAGITKRGGVHTLRHCFTAVLHTWNQRLLPHAHLHVLVPAVALRPDGSVARIGKGKFLFPVKALAKVFRAKFLAGLKRLQKAGKLRGHADRAAPTDFASELEPLYHKDWVVCAKRPFGGPKQVVAYLGRYTHRTAISNARIRRVNEREVAHQALDPDQPGLKLALGQNGSNACRECNCCSSGIHLAGISGKFHL